MSCSRFAFRRSSLRRAALTAATVAALAAGVGCSDDADEPTATAQPIAQDAAPAAGLDDVTQTHGENCIADVDGDGNLDVILSVHVGSWPLMLGRPDGRFQESTSLVVPEADRHGCAVADFDGDDRLDVYFSIGACRGTCLAPKELWIQGADGTFTEQAEAWGIDDPGARGRVAIVLDANGDGRPDLYTGAEAGVDHPSLSRLWINAGDHFELDEAPVTNDVGNLCAAAADLDGDGFDELAICTPEDGFHLYRNDGGTYVEATTDLGLEDYGRRTVELADLDGDGAPDLVTVARSRFQIHLNDGGRFTAPVLEVDATDGKDVAFGDVDGDGDLDVYLQEGLESEAPDRIFLNDGDGRTFTAGPAVPASQTGGGDSVGTFPDWMGSGRDAFLVNNGFQESPGPRQLVWVPPDQG